MAAKFSPSDAAVSIFSFAKQNSQFTLKYVALVAVSSLLISVIMAFSGLYEFNHHMRGINPNSGDMAPLLEGFKLLNWPVIIFSVVLNVFIGAIVSAIGLRKTILNQEMNGFNFSFGADEQNILKASFLIGLIAFGGIFAISFIGTLISMINSALAIVVPVLMVLGAVFMIGRFGQFGIYAILNKNNGLKDSYAKTKEQFWSYVGAYFLGFIIFIIITLIISAIMGIVFSTLFKGLYFANPTNQQEALAIGSILHQFFSSIIGGFGNLAFICIGSFAYHQMNASIESDEIIKN